MTELESNLLVVFKEHEKSDAFYHKMFISICVILALEIAFGMRYVIVQQSEIRDNQMKISRQQSVLMSNLNKIEK